MRPEWPHIGAGGPGQAQPWVGTQESPEAALWRAFCEAGPEGAPVALLIQVTGKGRTWVYDRLRQYAATGRVIQTIRGHWRATSPDGPPPDEGTR